MEPKIYKFSENEVHLFGEITAVIWNLKKEEKELKDDDGVVYKAKVSIRTGKPYISFVEIRELNSKTFMSEDSPVCGGMTLTNAQSLVKELQYAIDYLAQMQ